MKLVVLKNNVPINEVLVDTPGADERYEIYVGRADDCHVLIDDPLISRHHFVIKNEGQDWYCEKLSQLGLVLVNGSSSSRNPLKGNDEIKCGNYSILVFGLPAGLVESRVASEMSEQTHQPFEPVPVVTVPLPLQLEQEYIGEASDDGALDNGSLCTPNNDEEYNDETLGSGNTAASENEDFQSNSSQNSFIDGENSPTEYGEDSMSLEAMPNDESEYGEATNTQVLKTFVNYQLILFGEHAPYDRFELDREETFIGRDNKKCQIVLDDPEVSSVHAVLRKNIVEIILEDLNSSNGTILRGERINKSTMHVGDEFVIGSTTFTLEVKSDLLEAESDRLMPVESDQVIETEEFLEEEISAEEAESLGFGGNEVQEKSILKRIWKDPVKRKKLIYGLVVACILLVMFYEPEETVTEEKKVTKDATVEGPDRSKLQLSPEQQNKIKIAYEMGRTFFERGEYTDAEREFKIVASIDAEYLEVESYLTQTVDKIRELERIRRQKDEQIEKAKIKKMIEELLAKAEEAVKNRQVTLAESYFAQITEKDPENIPVQQLKLELEAWQKEEERKALEKAKREKVRKDMVDALAPGKTFYLKKEWYRAILKLEEFLAIKGTDEDLIKEASGMLSDAKNQLASDLGPLLGKARSLKEGQDLKSAYEVYLEILKIEPTNAESLNEVDDIKLQLDSRSKKIYREGIIAESLSLFADAKEKFQEVQQISPTDSEYYKKATEKLKNYLE